MDRITSPVRERVEVGGAESGHAVVDGLAKSCLHAGRRVVGRHGAPVVERARTRTAAAVTATSGSSARRDSPAMTRPRSQPKRRSRAMPAATARSPMSTGAHDAQPHAAGERPESPVEVHDGSLSAMSACPWPPLKIQQESITGGPRTAREFDGRNLLA